jgi:hypothetical protein
MLLALAAAGVLILHLTRGTTLWFDDWNWALYRRSGLDWLLRPYNEHLSLVPILVYRALFALAGIRSYEPYRVLITAGQLVCGTLVFWYARRRVGEYPALLAAVVILFLGPGWQNFLWPFQIAWLISLATGIGALLALDRDDGLGDGLTCALLLISLASSSVGVAITLGALAEIAWTRRSWRDAWIVAVPLGLYAIWALAYQGAGTSTNNVLAAWSFVFDSAAASLSAPLGLSGQTITDQTGTVLTYGAPLLVAVGLVMLWRWRGAGPWSPRAVSLAVILAAFWVLTAVGRANVSSPFASRYLYVDSVLALLLAVELGRGARARGWLAVGLGVLTAGAVLSNVGQLREAGAYLRSQAPIARADLAAFEITRSIVAPAYVARHFPGYPYLTVRAGLYFAMEHAIGSPAFSQSELTTAPEPAREVADAELIEIHGVVPQPLAPGAAPGRCLTWRPPAFAPTGAAASEFAVTLPAAGLRLRAGGAPATLGLRRFAAAFTPLGTVPAGRSVAVRIAPDGSPRPWMVQVSSQAPVGVCLDSPPR